MTTHLNFKKILQEAKSYKEYRAVIDNLLLQGKTTGLTQSEKLVEFTKLNVHRMNRLDKTIETNPNIKKAIQSISTHQTWILIADGWCGDCAQITPILAKIAALNPEKISFNIVNRDQFPELLDAFLTNGAKSTPKLILLNTRDFSVLKTWGPRPNPAQEIMLHWKKNKDTISFEEFETQLHTWYAKDKGAHIMQEIQELIENL